MTQNKLGDIRRLAQFLDSNFKLPGGFKFGWDGIIGLIPGVGDLATNIMSLYILVRGAHLGVSVPVLLRMGLNILIDNVVDFIPVFGFLFDFMWKSNQKNLALIEAHLQSPSQARKGSLAIVIAIIALFVIIFVGLLILSVQFAIFAFHQLQALISQQPW